MIKKYFNTFKLDSLYLYTLALDVLTFLVIGGAFWWIARYMQDVTRSLIGDQSAETIQSYLLTLSPEQLAVFSTNLQSFVVQLLLFLVLFPIVAFLLYSLSRAVMWNMIHHKNLTRKKYWRWNGVVIVLFLFAALFFGVFAILQAIADWIISSDVVFRVVHALLFSLAVTGYFTLMMISYKNFFHSHRVFESIGKALKKLKQRATLSLMGYALVTFLILELVQKPLQTTYFIYPTQGLAIQTFFFLLYLAWLRLLVVKEIKE